ncbi:MAG: hypothetical protein LBJ36_02685 [Synergistaceae bacterium]|nr:hypothetical protein [Synergistaceae bacterium]
MFTKKLSEYLGNYSVVDICSEAKTKLGQNAASVSPFGKETLFEELEKDFFMNFYKVLLSGWKDWRDKSLRRLDEFKQKRGKEIEKFEKGPLDFNEDAAKKIWQSLDEGLKKLVDEIQEEIGESAADLKNYYEKLRGTFSEKSDSSADLEGWEKILIVVLSPVLSVVGGVMLVYDALSGEKDKHRDRLSKWLDKAVEGTKKDIRESYRKGEKSAKT